MAENIQRSRGRPQGYKFDRGGMPAEMGPFIGIVVNNVDNTRGGRLQVWIAQFGATNKDGSPDTTDPTLWRTVSYCPPFYGATPQTGTSAGTGTYPGNRNSYGMWFTPPDLGTQVLCFFVGGDPNAGYYVGCIPEQGINHMIPAIGATSNYQASNKSQSTYLSNSKLLPVSEINEKNTKINENPKFFDQPKPVQSVVAGILFQQGLDKDPVRGPIRSTSQRESPSAVYGISTPGKPIYQGGLNPKTIRSQLNAGGVKPQDVAVVGRQGGHTFVMDDGDVEGTDALVRIRTAKGHQITMSDDGDSFYIIHANGQTWLEFGKQGTVDIFSTNSINMRTQGTLNLHADKDINMYAGGSIKVKAKNQLKLEGDKSIGLYSNESIALCSQTKISVKSNGTLALQGKSSSWNGGASLNFKGSVINLNGAATLPTTTLQTMPGYNLTDTKFVTGEGWTAQPGTLATIVTRAPTHEPYPYHSKGVSVTTDLNPSPTANTTPDQTSTTSSTASSSTLPSKAVSKIAQVSTQPASNLITAEKYVAEPEASSTVPNTADLNNQINAIQAQINSARSLLAFATDQTQITQLNLQITALLAKLAALKNQL